MNFLQNQRLRIKEEYLSYYELDGRYDEAYFLVIDCKQLEEDQDEEDYYDGGDTVWICYADFDYHAMYEIPESHFED